MPPNLTVRVSDPDRDSLTVTFYGRPVTTPAGPDFTLIGLPDTQHYTSSMHGGGPEIFRAQTAWIVENRLTRNIVYVGHVGDLVQNNENFGNPVEWIAADTCMRPLEDPDATRRPDGIPFGVCVGNHDLGAGGNPSYNRYFGTDRFAGRSYYGGHRANDNNNWFHLFNASGIDFIVLGLELTWQPNAEVVRWADSLLTAYSNRRAIVLSHYLLDPGPPATFSPQGQAIYDGLKGHTNLILMLCGHFVNEARRTDTYGGHTIHTVMANYQNWARGGDGWLRIMEFSPANNHIRMRTYSPTRDEFRAPPDSSAQFTLPSDLGGGRRDFEPLATFRRVASGAPVTIPWVGLRHGKEYEWYVTVSDRSTVRSSPIWRVRIADNESPFVRWVYPNGGEALFAGTWADLRWNATDDGVGVREADILLSRSGLTGPWEAIASQIPNTGSFRWRVTGPMTMDARFGVFARDSFYNFSLAVGDRSFTIYATTAVEDGAAGPLALAPVAPNPTTGRCRFGIVLPEPARIRLSVLDVGGREVAVLADGVEPAGRSEHAWDGRTRYGPVAPGLYFVRLEAAGGIRTRRFAVAR
jgi:hypothetical protein